MLLTTSISQCLVAPSAVSAAQAAVERAFPSTDFGERLLIGRRAQLGDGDMIYRPGLIGGDAVDSSLTYGEYDLDHFCALVDRALDGKADATFVDVGSGVGRLVLAAAEIWPQLTRCAGIERVSELHRIAVEATERHRDAVPALARCSFFCGDAAEALTPGGPLGDADVLFAYSSTWPAQGDLLTDFSAVCGRLRVGTRVVTTDRRLCSVEGAWQFELLDTITGPNRETGGESIGFVHEVTQSARHR